MRSQQEVERAIKRIEKSAAGAARVGEVEALFVTASIARALRWVNGEEGDFGELLNGLYRTDTAESN